MDKEKRVQLSLRMDSYAELLSDVKNYCSANRVKLTDFVAEALEKLLTDKLTAPLVVSGEKSHLVEYYDNCASRIDACEALLNELTQKVRNGPQSPTQEQIDSIQKLLDLTGDTLNEFRLEVNPKLWTLDKLQNCHTDQISKLEKAIAKLTERLDKLNI